jgi:hypothetical protein
MSINKIHYRNVNMYIACYFYHIRHASFNESKMSRVAKLKKLEPTKTKDKLLGAMA